MGRDEEIERTDRRPGGLQLCADIRIMEGGVEVEICDPKKAQKDFKASGLVRMCRHAFLYTGPKFGGDDH